MLVTVGYGGFSPSTFVEHLLDLGVETLVDVRYSPVSRRPGFSKGALASRLESSGIRYVHLKDLGAPKPLRELLAGMGDYPLFFSQYRYHAEQQHGALEQVALLGECQRVALMCLEVDPLLCHRHVIAELLSRQWPQLDIKVA